MVDRRLPHHEFPSDFSLRHDPRGVEDPDLTDEIIRKSSLPLPDTTSIALRVVTADSQFRDPIDSFLIFTKDSGGLLSLNHVKVGPQQRQDGLGISPVPRIERPHMVRPAASLIRPDAHRANASDCSPEAFQNFRVNLIHFKARRRCSLRAVVRQIRRPLAIKEAGSPRQLMCIKRRQGINVASVAYIAPDQSERFGHDVKRGFDILSMHRDLPLTRNRGARPRLLTQVRGLSVATIIP